MLKYQEIIPLSQVEILRKGLKQQNTGAHDSMLEYHEINQLSLCLDKGSKTKEILSTMIPCPKYHKTHSSIGNSLQVF